MKLTVMEVSLDRLERKVEQMLTQCDSLRNENLALRGHVTSLETERDALAKKIAITLKRLETLVARLPEE